MGFQPPRESYARWGATLALAGALCWCLAAHGRSAQGAETAGGAKAPAAGGRSSLDQQLLEDLDNELLDGVGKKMPLPKPAKDADKTVSPKSDAAEDSLSGEAARKPADGKPVDNKPGDSKPQDNKPRDNKPRDSGALDDESMGEDIGQGPEDPLTRIGREMRRVEQLIAQQEAALREAEADKTGQLQQQIIKELADLIDELEKQRQQQQSSSSMRKQKKVREEGASRDQVKQQQPGGSKPGSKRSSQPATDSSAELRNQNAQRPDVNDMKGLMKDLWGQLPAHARDQMLQTSPEQFLPRYELQLEKYYKRLAEQQKQNP
jgi:hypothetical protein